MSDLQLKMLLLIYLTLLIFVLYYAIVEFYDHKGMHDLVKNNHHFQ